MMNHENYWKWTTDEYMKGFTVIRAAQKLCTKEAGELHIN